MLENLLNPVYSKDYKWLFGWYPLHNSNHSFVSERFNICDNGITPSRFNALGFYASFKNRTKGQKIWVCIRQIHDERGKFLRDFFVGKKPLNYGSSATMNHLVYSNFSFSKIFFQLKVALLPREIYEMSKKVIFCLSITIGPFKRPFLTSLVIWKVISFLQ